MIQNLITRMGFLWICLIASPAMAAVESTSPAATDPGTPWWVWPVLLFFFCLVLGILAVLAGIGGGVLYVPLVSGFFPFHLDFVRGTGLEVLRSSLPMKCLSNW